MPTVSLAELRLSVYDDLDGNTGFFPAGQINAALNEGLRRLNLILGITQGIVALPGFTVANQLLYATPPGILVPMAVYLEGRELEKSSLREIAMRYRSWAVDTSDTSGPAMQWAPIGIGTFAIHPMDADGGSLLEVQGITPTVPLTADDQVVDLEDQWAELLVKYTRMRVLLKDSTAMFSQASGQIYPEFIRALKTAMIWSGMKFPAYFIEKRLESGEAVGAR